MPQLSIEELGDRFPDFRVAFLFAEPLRIAPRRSAALASAIAAAEADCRRRWGGVEFSAIPAVGAWRAAYKGFGIKRTSYRSSAERLIKRVLAGQPLPEINVLVDLYNMVSLETGLCLGCDDLDKTSSRAPSSFGSPGPATVFSTWGRRQARYRRSAQGGRSRVRRRPPRPLPPVELGPGRPHRLEP